MTISRDPFRGIRSMGFQEVNVGQNGVIRVREDFLARRKYRCNAASDDMGIRSRPLNAIRDTWNAGRHPRLASGVSASSEISYHSN